MQTSWLSAEPKHAFLCLCDFCWFHYYVLAVLWSSEILLQCTYISVLLLISFYVAVPSQLYFYHLALYFPKHKLSVIYATVFTARWFYFSFYYLRHVLAIACSSAWGNIVQRQLLHTHQPRISLIIFLFRYWESCTILVIMVLQKWDFWKTSFLKVLAWLLLVHTVLLISFICSCLQLISSIQNLHLRIVLWSLSNAFTLY